MTLQNNNTLPGVSSDSVEPLQFGYSLNRRGGGVGYLKVDDALQNNDSLPGVLFHQIVCMEPVGII